jgi:hypothetical protein
VAIAFAVISSPSPTSSQAELQGHVVFFVCLSAGTVKEGKELLSLGWCDPGVTRMEDI